MDEKILKQIENYADLKKVIPGELISIKEKSPEIVINPIEEFKGYAFSDEKSWNKHKIYTVSLDKPFLVLNQYDNYDESSDEFLVPYFKTSCRMFSGTPLSDGLMKIVNREGLQNA